MTVVRAQQQPEAEPNGRPQHQVQQQQQQQLQRERSGGGGGRGRGGGARLPEPPEGDNLGDFLEYVYIVLDDWGNRIRGDNEAFSHLHGEDRRQLAAGWADFQNQWGTAKERLQSSIKQLDQDDLRLRGLAGTGYRMKLHFVRKARVELQAAYEQVLDWLQIRKLWHKLFTAIDVILDSISGAIASVPVAGAIISGLREFKETAMGTCEVLE